MKNILVPIDFSEESANALYMAHQIAKKAKANILLSHAIQIANYSDTTSELDDSYKAQLLETVRKKMDFSLAQAKITIPKVTIKISIDHPFSHILELIKSEQIDLIIMGSKGARNWQGIMIGSTTQRAIRHSTCPVLIVKEKINIDEIEEIAFATDLSNTPHFVIRAFQEFQELFEARVHVLKVITPNNWGTDREVKRQMEEFVKLYNFNNYSMKIYNDVDVEDGIVHYAEDIDLALVAMTSHTKINTPTIITDYRVVERVVENSKCLVWTCGLGDLPH